MASESSSAVLDMTDDNDHQDVCDQDSAPLMMEHGYDIAVKVDSPMKQLSRLETFVTYRVRCTCARWPSPAYVRRRYNHFKVLHKRLVAQNPLLPIPPLPALHSARQQLDRYSAKFVALRAVALDAMLTRIAKHPILTHSEDFKLFVTTPDEELDKVLRTESGPLALWGLSSVLAGGQDNHGVRVKDPEFSSAYDYLQSLQTKLTVLCNLTNTLYKSHDALTKEYTGLVSDNWPASESVSVRRAVGALQTGAARRGAVRGSRGRPQAVLPLLAAYCGAVQAKIKERDTLHSAHVASTNSNETIHNRLEQASEALRSELTDWNAKTKEELKQILLDLAERQVAIHRQTLAAWESGLRLAVEADPQELFKTVSKQCVQNLSPSKLKPDTPTDKDFDDLSLNSEDNFIKINVEHEGTSLEELNNDNIDDFKERLRENHSIEEMNTNVISDFFMEDHALTSDVEEILNEDIDNIDVREKLSNKSTDNRNNINAALEGNDFKEILSENNSSSAEEVGDSKQVTSDPLSEFAEIDLSEK